MNQPDTYFDIIMAYNSKPWNLSHDKLQTWFQDEVEDGSRDFATKCNEIMDDLVRFLHGIAGVKVKEVRKVALFIFSL